MTNLSKEDRARWRNIWCILRSLDRDELEAAMGRVKRLPASTWAEFRNDPCGYLIRTYDRSGGCHLARRGEEVEMSPTIYLFRA